MVRTFFTAGALFLTACQANTFYVELQGETTVQGAPNGPPLTSFPTVSNFTGVDLDQSEEFRAEKVTRAEVRTLKLEAAELWVQSPPEQGLEFLDEAQLFVRSADHETLVSEEKEIASRSLGSPARLEFSPIDAELRSHVAAPTLSLIIRAKGWQPTGDTRLSAKVRLRVELGAF